jgi:hypothetical protein
MCDNNTVKSVHEYSLIYVDHASTNAFYRNNRVLDKNLVQLIQNREKPLCGKNKSNNMVNIFLAAVYSRVIDEESCNEDSSIKVK